MEAEAVFYKLAMKFVCRTVRVLQMLEQSATEKNLNESIGRHCETIRKKRKKGQNDVV